jgi:hypothetical protein
MRLSKPHLILAGLALLAGTLACQTLSASKIEPQQATAVVTASLQVETREIEPAMPTAGRGPRSESTSEPAATAQAPSPTTPEPQSADLPTLPPAEPGPETLDLEELPVDPIVTDFNESLQMDMTWSDPDGSEQQAGTTYSYRQQTIPAAAWRLVFVDDNPFLASSFDTAVIDGQGFSATPETGCQVVDPAKLADQDQREPFRSLLEALTGSTNRAQASLILNDQPADQYPLQAANLKPGAEIILKGSAADEQGEFSSTVTTTIALTEEGMAFESGSIYLAQQGGYVMRIDLSYAKTATEDDAPFADPGSRMERKLVYEITPAKAATQGSAGDEPISPPEGCEAEGLITPQETPATIDDIPRLEDATNVIQAEDALIYNSGASVEEALDFYRTEMAALGWEPGEDVTLGTLGTLEFTRGELTVSITILGTGDNVMVTISLN